MKNKKIGKFRKWLIKLLGGISPDEKIQPIIIESNYKPLVLKKSAIEESHIPSNFTISKLKRDMAKELETYIVVMKHFNIDTQETIYNAQITLLENKNDV